MKRFLIILFTGALFAMGCVEVRHDYKQCRDIEIARCELRANCKIYDEHNPNLENPFNQRFPGFNLDECIDFAREHCGTRKLGASSLCTKDIDTCVDECVEAIIDLGPNPEDPTAPGPNECDSLKRSLDETLRLEECNFIQGKNEEIENDGGTGESE
ncbi:MAG: hypothetical protein GY762_04885 [Proteobacteria bacterium]|nr:hypothetical protein [Pseudomonadota bacterium]